jgi:hypothetical protein
MAAFDRFVARALAQRPALLYGPKLASSPITNLGEIPLPDGVNNGGAQVAPGIIQGGAAIELDGSGDYIETSWKTRTNLVTNPNYEGLASTGYTAGTGVTITPEKYVGLYHCLKVVTDGKSSDQGISLSPDPTVEASATYTFVPLVIANNKELLAVRLWATNGTVGNSETLLAGAGLATLVGGSVERAMSATTTTADCRISTGAGVSLATTFWVFGFLLVKATIAELEAEHGSSDSRNWFFPYPEPLGKLLPDARGKLSAGYCGWSGVANASASDAGPLARGTTRTFVGMARRETQTTRDTLIGDSKAATPVMLAIEANNNDVSFWANATEAPATWAGAWPGLNEKVCWALKFDEAANTVELFINGESKGSKALTVPYSDPGSLLLGKSTFGSEQFCGRMLPFATFLRGLTPTEIYNLYRSTLPTRRRRKPPLALDVEVETPDGFFQLPSESRRAGKRPRNLSFSTQRGDGFATGSAQLARKIFKEYPDIALLDTWRMVGDDAEVAYEGRLHSNPRTNDPEEQIDLNFVGWATYLRSKRINPLIVDRRLGSWGEATMQRLANMLAINLRPVAAVSSGWQQDGAYPPGIILDFTSVTMVEGFSEYGESHFYAAGEDIGEVRYDFDVLNGPTGSASWQDNISLGTDDVYSVSDPGADHNATDANNQATVATGAGRKFARLRSVWEGSGAAVMSDIHVFRNLRVVGAHGLTSRGDSPNEGYYISEVLRFLLETYYPKIKWAGLENTFPVTQATWHDNPADGYDIFQQLNNLVLWETNIWEGPRFYFEPADLTKYDWQISTEEEGVTAVFEGDSIENFANGVAVTYTDFNGIKRILYPSDHAELRDPSEDNPAARHGEDLWTDAEYPYPCSESEALQFGRAYLSEFNRPKRPGTFTVQGYILDGADHWQQVWKVRNSHTLGVRNHPDDSPRLITATSYDDESKVMRISVDAPDKLLDAVIAQHELARQSRNL